MDIFGLSGYEGALLITILGIAAATIVGWLKGSKPFAPRQVAASAIIGFVVSIQVVVIQLQAIGTVDELSALAIIAGLIAQVAGFDALLKNSAKAVVSKIK